MKGKISAAIVFVMSLHLLLCGQEKKKSETPALTIEQVKEIITNNESVVLLDVRSKAEYDGPLGHLPGSLLIPLPELESRLAELDSLKDRQIVVYCRSGNRSRSGTRLLIDAGFDAYNMLGGMLAWNQAKKEAK